MQRALDVVPDLPPLRARVLDSEAYLYSDWFAHTRLTDAALQGVQCFARRERG